MEDSEMRVILKPRTIAKIEKLAGQKMTTRCDKVINKALDAASDIEKEAPQSKRCWLEPSTDEELPLPELEGLKQ